MPAALHIRHNAVSGLKRIASAEPLLPFLYNTRTIRTQFTDALSELETQQDRRPRQEGRNGDRKPHVRGHAGARRPGRDTEWKRFNFDKDGAEGDEATSSERSGYQHRRPMRPEHVPFEHAAQETESVRENISQSTMTPTEKKAFEELLNLQSKKELQGDDKHFDKLDNVLANAARQRQKHDAAQLPGELEEMKKKIQEEEAHTGFLKQAIEADYAYVDKAFDGAQTDVELWKVLHEKVLSRVAALNLDGPPTAQLPSRKGKAKASKEPTASTETETPSWPGNIPDQTIITHTLPRHLIRFQRVCFSDFPASQLSVSLLPYLKTLGPSTFALAVGSTLYTLHMRALFRRSTDLTSIISTLQEMDNQVYDLDEKSGRMLDIIMHKARSTRKGHYGPGADALWGGERFRKGMRSAIYWKKVVEERMQDKALRESREKEENPVKYIMYNKDLP